MAKPKPQLTKAELAALDFVIADAKDRPDSGLLSSYFWTAFAREALLMLIRNLVRQRLARVFVDDLGPIRKGLTEQQVADLNKELQGVVLGQPSLKELVELRNSVEVKD